MALPSEAPMAIDTAGTQSAARTRVLLVDDDAMVRQFMQLILSTDGIEVIAQCEDGDEVLDLVASHHPDVIIMDIRMARMNGIAATALLRRNGYCTGIIAVTSFDTPAAILDSVNAGVDGFLAKDSAPAEIIKAVRDVASGHAALSSRAAKVMLEHARTQEAPDHRDKVRALLEQLTSRELEVVGLVMQGLTNTEIGQRLHISASTVKTHVTQAMNKTGTEGRVQLAVLGAQAGIV